MNVLKKHTTVLGVGILFVPMMGYTSTIKQQEISGSSATDRPLTGFYLGMGTGMMGMKADVSINNTTGGDYESERDKFGNLTIPIQFSAGYEKTFKDVYVLGLEATYIAGVLNDKVNESFSDGAGRHFSVTNSFRAQNTFGLNVSLGRKLDSGLTPYVKAGVASTEFVALSASSGANPSATSWNVTQKKRVFGMAAGFGAKYALSRRVDFVAESLWTFYKSFITQNFSGVAGDSHSFKVNPLLYTFLIGIHVKI